MSDGRQRLRLLVDRALTVAAIVASLVAVTVVVALVWWVHSLSPSAPDAAVVPVRPAARRQADLAARDTPAPPPRAPIAAQHVAAAQAPASPTASAAARPTHDPNVDAAKNRALGAALSRLADDPELQRKLRGDATPWPR